MGGVSQFGSSIRSGSPGVRRKGSGWGPIPVASGGRLLKNHRHGGDSNDPGLCRTDGVRPVDHEPRDHKRCSVEPRAGQHSNHKAPGILSQLLGSEHAASLEVGELDRGVYPKDETITDAQMATLQLVPHRFHGGWNYTINPRRGLR